MASEADLRRALRWLAADEDQAVEHLLTEAAALRYDAIHGVLSAMLTHGDGLLVISLFEATPPFGGRPLTFAIYGDGFDAQFTRTIPAWVFGRAVANGAPDGPQGGAWSP